ncbi:RCC1/BLIP-II [Hymenopellis radicata]|nr:RCC1/BLIP-II [Hymenopellis radicata]
MGSGLNNFGQLGLGESVSDTGDKLKRNPWAEEGLTSNLFGTKPDAGFEAIAAGGTHILLLDENGAVWVSGSNDDAALGLPEESDILYTPERVQALLDENFRAVRIAAGSTVSAAISSEGELRVWGTFKDSRGPLGFSTGLKHQFKPSPLLKFPQNLEKFVSVAAGGHHLILLTSYGNVYSCGAGEVGELGRKVPERRRINGTTPEKVILGTRRRKASVVGAGAHASFAVDTEGAVWGWGLDNNGETGTGGTDRGSDAIVFTPTRVIGLSEEELNGDRVVQISGGSNHSLFLTSNGRVFACGQCDVGQLGVAQPEDVKCVSVPVEVPMPDSWQDDPVVSISASSRGGMAITAAGALYAWGEANSGELGLGPDVANADSPRVVVRRAGGSWRADAVACGGNHTLCLLRKRI